MMFKFTVLCVLVLMPLSVRAASTQELDEIRAQIRQLQQNEAASKQGARPATGSESAFNPAISLILSGSYGQLRQDPAVPATGFAMNPNPEHQQGFNLGESELVISANVDPQFRGVATFALEPDGGLEAENAFVQATALGSGFNFKMGRFFSGLGYLNEKHAHSWDFVDQPLVYRVMWDDQLAEDGIQLKWLAPTAAFIEFGGELGRGRGFPGSDRQRKNGAGSGVLFAHAGDDIGASHSWRAGISLHQTRRENALSDNVPDVPGTPGGVSNSFSGDSKTAGLDFIWKYAPDGNARETSFKLQGEYFRRKEDGLLTYDMAGVNTTDSYSVTQTGWYLQSVYQFLPRWRAGLRHDRLDPGTAAVGALNTGNVISNYGFKPLRNTLMIDYSPSEFSRLRLQVARDNSRQGMTDNQLFVQYVMSLGAHGAHQF